MELCVFVVFGKIHLFCPGQEQDCKREQKLSRRSSITPWGTKANRRACAVEAFMLLSLVSGIVAHGSVTEVRVGTRWAQQWCSRSASTKVSHPSAARSLYSPEPGYSGDNAETLGPSAERDPHGDSSRMSRSFTHQSVPEAFLVSVTHEKRGTVPIGIWTSEQAAGQT